jgi:MFS family permease
LVLIPWGYLQRCHRRRLWSSEAAIAIAYPEAYDRGKALGYWLTYRLSGQIIGGAVNLGLNANRDQAGQVSYTAFLVFIAIQALGPVVACFLMKPDKVERTDAVKLKLAITHNPWLEIWKTSKLFFRKEFLPPLFLIGQAVFAQAVYFTYLGRTPQKPHMLLFL